MRRGLVPDARHLRVVTFHPVASETLVDAALRERCLPALLGCEGIVDAWAGRKGSRSDPRRVLVTTWVDAPRESAASAPAMGMRAAAANAHDDEPDPPDLATLRGISAAGTSLTIDTALAVELAVHLRFDRPEPARILRVFHGTVRPGELDAYVADARTGTMADAVVNDGLVALALGPAAADDFVTVSAWTGWPAIEEATGGNTRVPIATRNAIRLTAFEVSHFELLPIG
jgi:hypothetical protein